MVAAVRGRLLRLHVYFEFLFLFAFRGTGVADGLEAVAAEVKKTAGSGKKNGEKKKAHFVSGNMASTDYLHAMKCGLPGSRVGSPPPYTRAGAHTSPWSAPSTPPRAASSPAWHAASSL